MNHIARQSTIVKVGTNNLDASSTTEVANMNNIRKNNTGREITIATKVNSVAIFLMAYNAAAFFKYNHLSLAEFFSDPDIQYILFEPAVFAVWPPLNGYAFRRELLFFGSSQSIFYRISVCMALLNVHGLA